VPLDVGDRAPGFRLRGIDNAMWILGEPDRRRSVLLCFFRRESATCRLLLPFLERVQRCARAREAEVLGISLDNQRDSIEFAEDYSFTFPILIETAGLETVRAYGVGEVPTLYRLDADLRVADLLVGWSRQRFGQMAGGFLDQVGGRARSVWEPHDAPPDSAEAATIPALLRPEASP
jgi:peroxiredoxin